MHGVKVMWTALTFLLCKLMEQARFSNAHITDDDILEDVLVRKRSHFDEGAAKKKDETISFLHEDPPRDCLVQCASLDLFPCATSKRKFVLSQAGLCVPEGFSPSDIQGMSAFRVGGDPGNCPKFGIAGADRKGMIVRRGQLPYRFPLICKRTTANGTPKGKQAYTKIPLPSDQFLSLREKLSSC